MAERPTDPVLWNGVGVWRATSDRLRPHLWWVVAIDLLFGVLSAFWAAAFVPSGTPDMGDRLLAAGLGVVLALAVSIFVVVLYIILRMPYRQRNAAIAALADHMDVAHHGDLALVIAGPTQFQRWQPGEGDSLGPEYLMVKVNFPLIVNKTGRSWNLSMWLDGWIGERSIELDRKEWRRIWNEYPQYRNNFKSNPLEVPVGDVIEGTVPFLMPFEEELQGQRLRRPRLVVRDNKAPNRQIVEMLPSTEDDTTEREWPS